MSRYITKDTPAPCVSSPSGLEDLSRQSQLFFVGEGFVEFLHIRIIHIIALRCLVNSRDVIKISRTQFLTEKEEVIGTLNDSGLPERYNKYTR